MTERERLIAVLNNKRPDRVPWFPDLGHWYRSEVGTKWSLFGVSQHNEEVAKLHRELKAGWYIDAGALHEEYYIDGVRREREMVKDKAIEHYITAIGEISMVREWSQISFSWDITKRMIETPNDLEILLYATKRRRFKKKLENWEKIEKYGKDIGLGFPSFGYTALGSLISYYMGVENTLFASYDEPELMDDYMNSYNAQQLEVVKAYCESDAPHLFFGDNLSSDIQPPNIFNRYSFNHYKNIAECVHKANKTISAHLDGRLNNIIEIVAKAGIDVADACTPAPNGDLSPIEIRKQAGSNMIIMGGISPEKWLPETSEKDFISAVREWLDLRKISSKIILSAGDQVPPGTKIQRIKLVNELVDEYGKY